MLAAVIGALPAVAFGHRNQTSSSDVTCASGEVRVVFDLDPSELAEPLRGRFDRDRSHHIEPEELTSSAAFPVLVELIRKGVQIERNGGTCTNTVASAEASPSGLLQIRMVATCRPGDRPCSVRFPLFEQLKPSHIHQTTIRYRGKALVEKLTADSPVTRRNRTSSAARITLPALTLLMIGALAGAVWWRRRRRTDRS